ncbi:MAG: orotidine 5-phosphate decarboxylase, partial [bacterium]
MSENKINESKISENVAKNLLEAKAVKLNIKEPFTFVSGIRSPIYCDNRKMIAFPMERESIIQGF